jgi:transcriptional regulator with XRE-family HTH domain
MDENINKELGARIRAARKALNLTQERFGKHFGLFKNTISNYEKGKSKVSPELLIKFANVLEVNPTWLLTGEGVRGIPEIAPGPPVEPAKDKEPDFSLNIGKDFETGDLNPDEELLISIFRGLPPSDRYQFLKFAMEISSKPPTEDGS